MTTNTLKLINEFLFDGGFAPGIDVDALEQEGALIAAAPDLLAALEVMAAHWPYWASQIDMKQIDRDAIAMARAAIAKATGAN